MDSNRTPLRKLDPTPSFDEEVRDFVDPDAYSGIIPFDGEAAKTRIDTIARTLAIVWTGFLIYIIFAQGIKSGFVVYYQNSTGSWASFYLVRPFNLETSEFIAVVTTITVSVFGFLVIVANHLFKKDD